jgi:hypothetical protein
VSVSIFADTQPDPDESGVPVSEEGHRIATFWMGEPPMLSKCPTAKRHGLLGLRGAGSPAVAPTGGGDTKDIDVIIAGDPLKVAPASANAVQLPKE